MRKLLADVALLIVRPYGSKLTPALERGRRQRYQSTYIKHLSLLSLLVPAFLLTAPAIGKAADRWAIEVSGNHVGKPGGYPITGKQDTDIINSGNYTEIVAFVMRGFSGENYRREILLTKRFLQEVEPDTVTATGTSQFDRIEDFICENEGSVRAEYIQSGTRTFTIDAEFSDCHWQNVVLDGNAFFEQFDGKYFVGWSGTINFTEFSLTASNGSSLKFSGRVTDSTDERSDSDTRRWKNNLQSLVYITGGQKIELGDMNTEFFFCFRCLMAPPVGGFSGNQTFSVPELAHDVLHVTTVLPFENSYLSLPPYQTGRLQITAPDGSQIIIDADNGSLNTVNVTLSSSDSSTQLVEPWSIWLNDLAYTDNLQYGLDGCGSGEYPPPINVQLNENVLSWEAPVPGLLDKSVGGYNIYRQTGDGGDSSYYQSVAQVQEFQLIESGGYQVVAYDEDACYFSNQGIQPVFQYQSDFENPSPVNGLTAAVYSATAAEVFWDRSNAESARYRIYVNGDFLTETDGISWFFENLPSDQTFNIAVAEIHPNGNESELRTVSFRTLGLPGSTTPECQINGLRYSIYSATAAEVFWDRALSSVRYNLWLDSTFLINTDAISWYFDGYEPGSTHRLTVMVEDEACHDVESSVEFTLPVSGGGNGQSHSPGKPGNLHAIAYSSSAIELFWNPSSDDGWVMGYDVFRDGVLLADRLDAKSYFDDTLLPGQLYTYTVVAIDDHDNRSSQASVSVRTFDEPSESIKSTINKQNHVELIGEVFQIYKGDKYIEPLEDISNFTIEGRNPDFSFIDVFNCEFGSYEQDLNPTSTNAGIFFTFEFSDCVLEDVQHNGIIAGQDGARGLNWTVEQYDVYRDESTHAVYNGYIQKWISQSAYFDSLHSFDTSDNTSVEFSSAHFELSAEQMNSSFGYGSTSGGLDQAWLRGGFNARVASSDRSLLAVSTPVEFSYKLNNRGDGAVIDNVPPATEPVSDEDRNNWTFSLGQLRLVAEDGSTLEMDADNNNSQTVTIRITSDDGVEEFDQPWSLWRSDLRFSDYPELTQ